MSVFRNGGVSYLRIPADDPARSAAFYGAVFGWKVGHEGRDPGFEDGTGALLCYYDAASHELVGGQQSSDVPSYCNDTSYTLSAGRIGDASCWMMAPTLTKTCPDGGR